MREVWRDGRGQMREVWRGGADRGVPGRQCGCAVVAEVCGLGDERAARGQMYTGAVGRGAGRGIPGQRGADERGVAGGNKKSLQSKKQYSKKDTGVALATSSRRDTAGGGLAALYQ